LEYNREVDWMRTKTEIIEEWRYFCNKVNFGQSALDARAIRFMNEFERSLNDL
jgi:hypothetical protein